MRTLITGVTGFIGNALARRLLDLGHDVYGLVRFTSNPARIPEGVKVVHADLTDYHSVEMAVRVVRPEVVFHLAALTPVSLSFDQPEAYIETNFLGTVRLLEALRKHSRESLQLFALAGTTEMYDTSEPIDEHTPFSPKSPYAVSKVAAVRYAKYMHAVYGMPVVIVVPCNTYGRANVGQRHFVIEKVITSMLEGKKRIVMGNPDAKRDFMFREDHVNAYLSVMRAILDEERENLLGGLFVFGTGKAHSILEVFEICREITGWDGEVLWNAYIRPYDQPVIVTNPRRAMLKLGWKPKYDLNSGLRRAVREWKERLGVA